MLQCWGTAKGVGHIKENRHYVNCECWGENCQHRHGKETVLQCLGTAKGVGYTKENWHYVNNIFFFDVRKDFNPIITYVCSLRWLDNSFLVSCLSALCNLYNFFLFIFLFQV